MQLWSTVFLLMSNNRDLVTCHFAYVYTFVCAYVNLSSSSSIPDRIVSHQCWLISCFDPVCLHVPAVDRDDDRCFKWHFSANNLLSYWFPAQISCSALFQQMDFVPCCPSPHPSSFLMFLYFTEKLICAFRTSSSHFILHIAQLPSPPAPRLNSTTN